VYSLVARRTRSSGHTTRLVDRLLGNAPDSSGEAKI
jgi:hypothetical protein